MGVNFIVSATYNFMSSCVNKSWSNKANAVSYYWKATHDGECKVNGRGCYTTCLHSILEGWFWLAKNYFLRLNLSNIFTQIIK